MGFFISFKNSEVVMSNQNTNLVNMFLGAIGKPSMSFIELPEFGKVGVRTSMLLGERSKFYAERTTDTANALLLQKTVCDPDTGILIFSDFTLEQINSFPTHVVDPLLDVALQAVGIKKAAIEEEAAKLLESEELKNSETDQT